MTDPATISALSALAGSSTATLPSVATTWLTQHRQDHMQRLKQASRKAHIASACSASLSTRHPWMASFRGAETLGYGRRLVLRVHSSNSLTNFGQDRWKYRPSPPGALAVIVIAGWRAIHCVQAGEHAAPKLFNSNSTGQNLCN